MNSPAARYLALLAVLMLSSRGVAGLQLTWPEGGGPLTLNNTGDTLQSSGVNMASAGGHLSGGEDPDPWGVSLDHTPNAILFVTFPPGATLLEAGGTWELSASYHGPGGDDLAIAFGIPGRPTPVGSLGDFDQDGMVGRSDIDLLASEIARGTSETLFDLDCDGLVDQDDLDLFLDGGYITSGDKLNGDADFNGTAAFADFLILSAHFGQEGKKWSEGDFIANGRVEVDDFFVLAENFGRTATTFPVFPVACEIFAVPVPEPDVLVSLWTGLLLIKGTRQRRRQAKTHT